MSRRRRRVRQARRRADTSAAKTRAYTDFWQGAGVDRTKLSQALPRLADTADELKAVAQKLGAPRSDIHLRPAASETAVKRARSPTIGSSISQPTGWSPATSRASPSLRWRSASRSSRPPTTTAC